MAGVDVTALAIEVKSIGIKEASNSLGGLSTSAANAEKRIAALTAATEKLNTISTASASAMNSYMAKLQQQAALMQSLSTSSAGASASTQALAAAMALLAGSLLTLNQRTTQADSSQRRHNEGMREAHALARGLAGGLGALWMTYGNLMGMAVGVSIAGSLKAIVTMGTDVEHTLEGIRVRGQETVESINAIRTSLLELGQGVYGPQQVAKAFETLILAGLNAQQSLASITAALNLATVGGTTIEQSAKTLVSVGSSIGYVAEGYRRIGDVIAKTAALSMSSVETLSEAFKSASSVAKLYGVSLEDIATSLGVLSNLGIQGSAAGTALKNMYKELASEADKVQNTFKKMGLSSMSLKDSSGNFLPLLTVIKELDGALSKLSPQEEKLAIARLSNERGMRLMVQALDLYRTKLGDGSNALQKFKDDATDSYGFAAMGAVQMAQTAKSQIDSMMNTLKTVFVQTFKSVEPEVILFTQSMKSAFNSPEFKAGILGIANAAGSLALSIAENLPLLTKMIGLFLALKAAAAISALLESVAAGMMAIRAAMTAMAAGTLTLTVAMPALAAVLAVATAAWVAYSLAKGEAIAEKSSAVAAAYSKSVIDGMIKEAEETKKATALIKEGKNAQDAAKQVERDNMLQQMRALDLKALANARDETENARRANNSSEYGKGLKKIAELELRAANNAKIAAGAQKALADAAKENAIEVERQAKLKGARPDTTNTLGGDVKKAVATDMFGAEIQSYQNEINAAKKLLETTKRDTQSAYRQGLIGERGLIEENYTAEVTAANSIIKLLKDKVNAAVGAENKRALAMKYTGEIQAQQAALDAAEATRSNKNAEWEVNNEIRIQKATADKYIAQGKFEAAYEAEFGAKRELRIKGIKADLESETNAVRKSSAEKVLAAYEEEQAAGRAAARNKEASVAFNTAADEARNMLKGVQTASEGGGLAAMFEAAVAATEKYRASLPGLAEQMKLITDPKDIAEAQARMTNNAENFRKMWVGVGESITHSLKAAFGSGGEAAGKLIKIAQDYNNLEVKSGSARIKSYGDAAGAAKGFFKEGTSGYMVLAAAEKAFRALELAGMLQSLVMTGTVEAGKQAFKVPTVLMEFMSQMGPWGLAAGAAAIAAIGVSASGGGGGGIDYKERQRTQSTGSVLGNSDAKSESIANSLSILEKNSGLGLAHSTTMIRYLKNVSDNIAGLASALLVRAGVDITKGPADYVNGGFVGKISNSVFGGNKTTLDTGIATSKDSLAGVLRGSMNAVSYNQTKEDGGWFSSDKYRTEMKSLGTDTNAQFTKVISNMADSIKAAAKDLGVGGDAFTAHLNTFIVDIGSISAKGLTGTEVQKALEEAFSKLGDDMAKFAIVGLDKFQKVGEGYLETVMRVANDLLQVKDVFAVLGKTFNLTGIAAVNVSESLITAVGGLDRLGEGAKFFVDNFLTEAEKMGPITASVTNEMARLGYGSINTVEGFSKLVRSLDLTDPASQRLYGSLMDIAPQFLEAANYATKLADGTVELTKAQQKALDGINKAKSQLQDSYNSESSALQGTIDKTKTFITTLKNYQDSLKLGADSPLTNMQKYAEARKQFDATALAANGGDQAAKDRFTSASSALLAASKVVNASGDAYTSDFNMVQSAIDTLMGSAGTQVDVAQASLNALNASVQGLIDINKSVMSVTDAIKALQSAITLGSAAGLVSNDGGTTYVPTPAQVAAATPSTTTMPAPVSGFVTVVQNLQNSVDALREEQKAQTGALVKATYESNETNAEDTVDGLSGIIKSVTKQAAQHIALV